MGRARSTWLGYWRAMQRYHRYSVDGLEHLDMAGAALIVGYHGRPFAHDLCMLTVAMHERYGYLPHAVIHGAFDKAPGVIEDLGFVTGDDGSLGAAVDRGEHLLVAPGGVREGCRSYRERYQVAWGRRRGYLRLARRYSLPIVPVAAHGVDDVYVGLNDGYALGKRVGMPARLPLWFGVGLGGLWPWVAPLPVRIRQRVGPPIPPEALESLSLAEAHRRVTGAVQSLLDDLAATSPLI